MPVGQTIANLLVRINTNSAEFGRAMNSVSSRFAKVGARMVGVGARLGIGISAPLTLLGAGAVKASLSFETAMAKVAKTVKNTDLGALGQDLRQLSTEIPVATTELAAIAEEAGRLGVAGKDILTFTKTVTRLAETSTLSSEESALALARLGNILGITGDGFNQLATSISILGSEFASNEQDIAAFALRIGAVGKLIGLSAADIVAFGSAFSSVGVKAERGGTAIQKTFIKVKEATLEGGRALEIFSSISGKTTDEFRKDFEQDAAKAISAFIGGLSEMEEQSENVFAALQEVGLGGDRVTGALLSMSEAGDLLNTILDRSREAYVDLVSLLNLANTRWEAGAARLSVFLNILIDTAVTIGDELVPVILKVTNAIGDWLKENKNWIKENAKLIVALGATAAAIPLITVALGGLSIAIGAIIAGPLGALTLILGVTLVAAASAVALTFKELGIIWAAVTTDIAAKAVSMSRAVVESLTFVAKGIAKVAIISGEFSKLLADTVVVNLEEMGKKLHDIGERLDIDVVETGGKAADAMDRIAEKFKNISSAVEAARKSLSGMADAALDLGAKLAPQDNLLTTMTGTLGGWVGKMNEGLASLGAMNARLNSQNEVVANATSLWQGFSETIVAWSEQGMESVATFSELTLAVFEDFTRVIGDAIADTLIFGESFEQTFSDLAKRVAAAFISSLVSMTIRLLVFSLLQKIFGKQEEKASKKSVSNKAGEAAASGFASVMAALPFPLNVIVAPIVAAAAGLATQSVGLGFIGGLAEGGTVMGPTLAILGEAGPERVIPLGRNDGFGEQTIVVMIDGRVLAKSTARRLGREVRLNVGGSGTL